MYLRQNSKMKKAGVRTYNFGLPAFRSADGMVTCPNAKHCVKECYARAGRYHMPVVKAKQESSLRLTQNTQAFDVVMCEEISTLLERANKKGEQLAIRIHDSGDFYSRRYFADWLLLAANFPDVVFYGYTKEVELAKELTSGMGAFPPNFRLVFSYGGKNDELIGPRDRHSLVFPDRESIKAAGYVDATDDDTLAWKAKSNKIGLAYRGRKKFVDTPWAKVYQSVINNQTRSN